MNKDDAFRLALAALNRVVYGEGDSIRTMSQECKAAIQAIKEYLAQPAPVSIY